MSARRGRVILLTGASSSGKSTLARALQDALDEPFLVLSSDQWVDGGMLPQRREATGPFDWVRVMRPRFFDGFHRTIAAMVDAGNDLVVDHIIEHDWWRTDLARLLAGHDVFLVGVHCDLDELDRREAVRGDRSPGEGRTHVEVDGIHTFGAYDAEVDTSSGVTADLVDRLVGSWRERAEPGALFARPDPDGTARPETIRPLRDDDVDVIVEFSVRAWAPVFASLDLVLGPTLAVQLNGDDWRVTQAQAVRRALAEDEAWVAEVAGRAVGFVAIGATDAQRGLAEIDMLAVDPDAGRRGIGTRLTAHATDELRRRGTRVAMVETGGDPGHAPARATYERAGYTRLPIARYFRSL